MLASLPYPVLQGIITQLSNEDVTELRCASTSLQAVCSTQRVTRHLNNLQRHYMIFETSNNKRFLRATGRTDEKTHYLFPHSAGPRQYWKAPDASIRINQLTECKQGWIKCMKKLKMIRVAIEGFDFSDLEFLHDIVPNELEYLVVRKLRYDESDEKQFGELLQKMISTRKIRRLRLDETAKKLMK